MTKISKKKLNKFIKKSKDYIYKNNDGHLRERYAFQMKKKFVCVEGNTSGFFIDETIDSFSNASSWVRSA